MVATNKKAELNVADLLSRQNYLVVQANDLAKAFGGLSAFEHRVLDYCFSCVTKDSKASDEYQLSILDIIKHFNLKNSGDSYKRVGKAFKRLNENTALYLPISREGVPAIRMTQLFSYIDLSSKGKVFFRFSDIASPYIFDLRKHFYSFHLSELANIKGKYALIFLKLWEAYRKGKEKYTFIDGSMDEWQEWLLGKDKRLSSGHFYSNVIVRGTEELEEKLNVRFTVTTKKRSRKTVGYSMVIEDTAIKDLTSP